MENLSREDQNKIIALIKALIPHAKIYLFGSRARKTNTARSDVDIAIDAGKLLRRTAIDEAHSVLQASNLMYRVDVLDLHQVDEEMRKEIMKDALLWTH
jgi:uncharacterized protein